MDFKLRAKKEDTIKQSTSKQATHGKEAYPKVASQSEGGSLAVEGKISACPNSAEDAGMFVQICSPIPIQPTSHDRTETKHALVV